MTDFCIHLLAKQLLSFFSYAKVFLCLCLQSMIELSRTQDEEVGDGTTSVIVLGRYILKLYLSMWSMYFISGV
jgi:hypothetical protein